jgi:biotin carboxylase
MNKNRALLVLGAGPDQLFMIKTAQAMGYITIAVDANPSAVGLAVADHAEAINFSNLPRLFQYIDDVLAKGIPISGVSTMGSDVPHLLAAICKRYNWLGPSEDTGRIATNKLEMKMCFRKKGIPIPEFMEVKSPSDVLTFAKRFSHGIIIKPIDRSGSRGVFYINQHDSIEDLFNASREFSFAGRVMAEEYLAGVQISTETIMYNGKGVTPGFADRNYEYWQRFTPRIIENGGTVPSALEKDEQKAVEELVEKASLALGVENGVTKGDVVMTTDGPRMIEMAARLSGGDFSESLVPIGTGVNYVRAVIKIAMGEQPDLTELVPNRKKFVANRYFFHEPGTIREISGLDVVKSWPFVKKLEFWIKPGMQIPILRSHADRLGVFIVEADSLDELNDRIQSVYKKVKIISDLSKIQE